MSAWIWICWFVLFFNFFEPAFKWNAVFRDMWWYLKSVSSFFELSDPFSWNQIQKSAEMLQDPSKNGDAIQNFWIKLQKWSSLHLFAIQWNCFFQICIGRMLGRCANPLSPKLDCSHHSANVCHHWCCSFVSRPSLTQKVTSSSCCSLHS